MNLVLKSWYRTNGLLQARVCTWSLEAYNEVLSDPNHFIKRLSAYANSSMPKLALEHASKSLVNQLAEAENNNKRLRKLSFGIFKYCNRHANRTVPFGLFVAHRAFINSYESAELLDGLPIRTSECRVGVGEPSKFRAYKQRAKPSKSSEKLGLNPTIVEFSGVYYWVSLYNRFDGETKNMRLKQSGGVSELCSLLRGGDSYPRVKLSDFLLKKFPSVDPSKLNAFVIELEKIGLLQPEYGSYPGVDRSMVWFAVDPFSPFECRVRDLHDYLVSTRAARSNDLKATDYSGDFGSEFIDVCLPDTMEINLSLQETRALERAANTIVITSARKPEAYFDLEHWSDNFLERYGLNTPIPLSMALNPYAGVGPVYGYGNPSAVYSDRPHRESAWNSRDLNLRLKMLRHLEIRNQVAGVDLADAEFYDDLHTLEKDFDPATVYPDLDFSIQLGMRNGEKTFLFRSDCVALGGHTFTRSRRSMEPKTKDLWRKVLNNLALDQGVQNATILLTKPVSAAVDYLVPDEVESSLFISTEASMKGTSVADLYVVGTAFGTELVTKKRDGGFAKCVVNMPTLVIPLAFKNEARAAIDISRQSYRVPSCFSWAQLEESDYLPEVRFGSIVLRPSEWKVSDSLRKNAKECLGTNAYGSFRDALSLMGIKGDLFFASGDNRLHFDTRNDLSLEGFARLVVHAESGDRIEKSSLDGARGVKFETGKSVKTHSVELIFSTSRAPRSSKRDGRLQHFREYHAGSPELNWVTLTFLTAPEVMNRLVLLCGDYSKELYKNGLISSWFYVRYTDDGCSLRLRWCSVKESATLWEYILDLTSVAESQALLRNWYVGNYVAETARYGTGSLLNACHTAFRVSANLATDELGCLSDSAQSLGYREALKNTFKYLGVLGVPFDSLSKVLPANLNPGVSARKFWRLFSPETSDLYNELDNARLASTPSVFEIVRGNVEEPAQVAQILLDLLHMHINRLRSSGGSFEDSCYWLMRQALRKREFLNG